MPTTGADAALRLEGRGVVLRPLRREDLAAALPLASEVAVAEMTARIPHPLAMADLEAWFEALHAPPAEQVFAILRRDDGAFMGAIGLVALDDEPGAAELGFWLGAPFWGRGHMAEAIGLVLAHAFGALGCAVVRAGAFPDNARSIAVQERVGMRPAGRVVRPAPARGGDSELVLYAIDRAAWRAAQRS